MSVLLLMGAQPEEVTEKRAYRAYEEVTTTRVPGSEAIAHTDRGRRISLVRECDPPSRFVQVPHQKDAAWVHELFERTVDRFPTRTALVMAGSGPDRDVLTLTYCEMERCANRVAHSLACHISAPNKVVVVAMAREPALFYGHLGVLKAGAACCFADPGAPNQLLLRVLDDRHASYTST